MQKHWYLLHCKHWYLWHCIHATGNISDFENIHIVNPLYFIIGKIDGYIEEKNKNKFSVFASTDKNKKVLKNKENFGMRLKIWLNAIPLKK